MALRAIDVALNFARMPALARQIETIELPDDVGAVIGIAAEEPEACSEAVASTGQPLEQLIEASRFYVQQVLLRPNANPYRVLGINPGASRDQARQHMMMLLRWLHPDRNEGLEAIYAQRVIKAWKQLVAQGAFAETSMPDAAAPKSRPRQSHPRFKLRSQTLRLPLIPRVENVGGGFSTVWLSKPMLGVFGGLLLIFLLVWTSHFWILAEK